VEHLSRVRKSILPQDGDGWAEIAARELPGVETEAAVSQLQSWNLHVFLRANARMGQPGKAILPSDVIFLEPPLART